MTGRRLLVLAILVAGAAAVAGVRWSASPAPPVPEPGDARALVWFDTDGDPVADVPGRPAAWRHVWFDHTEALALGVVAGSAIVWMVDLATGEVQPHADLAISVTGPNDRVTHVGTTHVAVERASDARQPLPSLWIHPLGAQTDARPFPRSGTAASQGRFSADQRWMAYVSHESGTPEVYVTTFPDAESRWLISSPAGGVRPVWRSDSLELYYWAPGGRLMRAPLKRGNRFVQPLLPTSVFVRPDLAEAPVAVTRDGTRFLIAVPR